MKIVANIKKLHFSVLTDIRISQKATPWVLESGSPNKHEKKGLVRTAMDEEFHTRRVEHSTNIVCGKKVFENEPKQDEKRKHSRSHQNCKLFP